MDHIKNQQRLHAVVGKTLPRFRERDIPQAARVSEKTAVVRIMHGVELEIRNYKLKGKKMGITHTIKLTYGCGEDKIMKHRPVVRRAVVFWTIVV